MKSLHLKSILTALLISLSIGLFSQTVAINTAGNSAYTGAILDLSNANTSGTVGFLPPYVTLTSATTLSPVVGTAANLSGLLVYNTGGALASGLYYWNNALATPSWVYVGNLGTLTAANNGLTVTGSTVQLGGTLSVNPTTITQAGNTFTITGGTINLNNSGAFGTVIGNGGTGSVTIGNSTGHTFMPEFSTANGVLYNSTAGGQLTSLPPNATATNELLTQVSSGAPVWESAATFGAASYILNQTTVQNPANFNISATGTVGGLLTVSGGMTETGTASINATTANTTTIGNGTNVLNESGNITINATNGTATTNIGTGGTTGVVSIGGWNGGSARNYNYVGICQTGPVCSLDMMGFMHLTGNLAGGFSVPSITSQGAYISYNQLNGGGTFETDFMNNWGIGTGGFAFYNTSPALGYSGAGTIPQVFITGAGKMGIGTGATPAVNLLDVNGGVAIGTYAGVNVAPADGLIVSGATAIGCSSNHGYELYVDGTLGVIGAITATGTITASTAVTACSDIRFKKDITPLNNSLENIMKLRGVNYYLKTNEFPDRHFSDGIQIGFIAQELEKVYPEVVFTDDQGYKSVDYSRLTPVIVEAIKAQENIIDSLSNKITTVTAEINAQASAQTQYQQYQDVRLKADEQELAELKQLIYSMPQVKAEAK